MCYDDKYQLQQDKKQMRYKETFKGPIRPGEFSSIENRLNLPDNWIFEQLLKIGYIKNNGEVIGTKTQVKEIGIRDNLNNDITQKFVTAISNRGRTHIVATGIFGQVNPNIDHRHQEGIYEANMNEPIIYSNDRYSYIMRETCMQMRVNYKKFMAALSEITAELLNESEDSKC